MMRYAILFIKFIILLMFSPGAFAQQPNSPLTASFATYQTMKAETPFKLEWVALGPTVNSARADVVEVDAAHPGTMYVGFGSGGLWKTVNHGVTWQCIFEEQSALGLGDFELAPSNTDVIYLGTGEHLKKPRNFTLPGTGMYRSDDAGRTWRNIGLEDSWSIAEIAVHPTNPDIVLVAVLGHLWSKNKHRGLYRTANGGQSWQQVLYLNDSTGANDIVISPSDPDMMYASMWEVYPGISGKSSGVYASRDGGKTWSPTTSGLPSGHKTGRIGLAVSATNPLKAYALVDNLNYPDESSAELYKTTNGGMNWTRTHQDPLKIFSVIGWYFTDVFLSPQDDDEVYCLGVRLAHSTDGGASFSFIGGQVTHMTPSLAQGLHLDQCELWINPTNPRHLALGNDGGFYLSYDKGLTWVHYNNIPTGEFYDITIDQKNYLIYGGTQDDATVVGPPREFNPRFPDPWKYVWIDPWDGGDGCITQIDPDDPSIIYYSRQHGDALRLDKSKDVAVSIMPSLPRKIKDTLVFNYMTPYFLSAFDSKTLYHGGNYVLKSKDRGDTWAAISPNLAHSAHPAKQSFATGTIVQSPLNSGLLYAGTDHGAFWVSKNDGGTWDEYSSGLAHNYIRSIASSRFQPARVFVAMTGINYDDLGSYLYVSEDYGKNWRNIAAGLPSEPINVIKEDPVHEDILYAGSVRGVYVSLDRGRTWYYLGCKMPGAAIADLEIHLNSMDLIAATHGRGIYKIDLKPIHTMVKENLPLDKNYFFNLALVSRPWFNSSGGEADYRTLEKLPITFWLKQTQSVNISVVNKLGQVVWQTNFPGQRGFNQCRWDLVIKKQNRNEAYFFMYDTFIEAGSYQVKIATGDEILQRPLTVTQAVSPYLEKH